MFCIYEIFKNREFSFFKNTITKSKITTIIINTLFIGIFFCSFSGISYANEELLRSKNCLSCHNGTIVGGPTFQSIGMKYRSIAASSLESVAQRITNGSSGIWGPTGMSPQNHVSIEEARFIAAGLLGLPKPQLQTEKSVEKNQLHQPKPSNTRVDDADFVGTADGFDFKPSRSSSAGPSGWIVEAFGGPCRSVGIDGFTERLEGFFHALKPDFINTYFIQLNAVTSNGLSAKMQISYNTNYSYATRSYRDQLNFNIKNRAPASSVEAARDNYKKAECVEMNHIQYVHAFQNWARTNEKAIRRHIGK